MTRLRRAGVIGLVLLSAVVVLRPASADHALLHERPEKPAVARFPDGFRRVIDTEWGFDVGGFGGTLSDDGDWLTAEPPFARHHPVIFVHGNVVDAADWYPVRDQLITAGDWDPDDLWALSYNGLGNNSGSGARANDRRDREHQAAGGDGMARNTDNELVSLNVDDLAGFIKEVLRHRNAGRYSIVAHSLGVTVARRTLELHPALTHRLVAFVGIAGANHGTSLCPPGSAERVNSCDEIEARSEWLARLNDEPDEFGSAKVMTVYDGTGVADVAFIGPTYAKSPRLADIVERAVDCEYARGHNDLRLASDLVEAYRAFIEAAEDGATGTCGPAALPDPT